MIPTTDSERATGAASAGQGFPSRSRLQFDESRVGAGDAEYFGSVSLGVPALSVLVGMSIAGA